MREVYFNEVRGLMPAIRRRFLEDRQRYSDQERPIRLEDEHSNRLQRTGEAVQMGGHRPKSVEKLLYDKVEKTGKDRKQDKERANVLARTLKLEDSALD